MTKDSRQMSSEMSVVVNNLEGSNVCPWPPKKYCPETLYTKQSTDQQCTSHSTIMSRSLFFAGTHECDFSTRRSEVTIPKVLIYLLSHASNR
jgi:hypothetical protein